MDKEAFPFERIETLIPFKEPEFEPRSRMGKLNLESSAWAISAKLGRYLLSGVDPAVMGEVSRTVAAYFIGVEEADLVPIGPEDMTDLERREFGQYAEGASFFRSPKVPDGEDPALVVVSHGKALKKHLGEHVWRERRRNGARARVNVMKLPCALGLMEVVSQIGSREALLSALREEGEKAYYARADTYRDWFREQEAAGRVTYGRDAPEGVGGRKPRWWAEVTEGAVPGKWVLRIHDAYEEERVMVEGTAEERAAAAWKKGIAAALEGKLALEGILRESKWSDRGAMASVFRELAEERWDEEACREANRLYSLSEHIAGVFEDKKQCDEAHREAASSGYLARSFKHVEVDDDVDLAEYRRLVDEFEARDRAGEIPRIAKGDHELRFRKCGRHNAIGVYAPLLKAIAVDPRAPRSLLHEFAHAYDFGHGMLSVSPGFRPVLKAFRDEFKPPVGMGPGAIKYYKTPTEVFARSWEVYAALNGYGGSFVKEMGSYRQDPAYAPLVAHAQDLAAYFDGFAKATGQVRAVSAQERALGLLAGGEGDLAELRRLVVSGEVDVGRLGSDLAASGQVTPEQRRVLADLSFASAFAPSAVSAPAPAVPSPAPRAAGGEDKGGEQMSLFDLASLSDEELDRRIGAPRPIAAQAAAARDSRAGRDESRAGQGRDSVSRGSEVSI